MYKNNILNLVLLIVVISLISVIYFSDETNTELDKLSLTDKDNISTITIQHNRNNIVLNRENNHWYIKQPVQIAANEFRIKSIIGLINAPIHNKYTVDEIDLSSIGLDKPTTSIKLNGLKISFGITNPATNLRYVLSGDYVYTIEDVYYPLISSNVGALVSLYLLPKNSRIEKLILLNQTISKDGKGLWKSNINISADNINKTIEHWTQDQAFGVHEYLQRDRLGEVFIFLKGQQHPVNYQITDTAPWLILARPEIGLEYHLDIEAYDKLIAPQ